MSQADHHRRRIARQNSGFIYVIQFSTGLLKVGQSRDLPKRLKQHRDGAHRQRQAVVSSWGSPRHTSHTANEDRLISFCLKHYGPAVHGKETFENASFAEVVSYAESLSFPVLTGQDVDRLMRKEDGVAELARLRFQATQVAGLRARVELINSLANEHNRWQTHDAHFAVAEELMRLTPAAWHADDSEAVFEYLTVKTGRPADRKKARDFEISFRALFAMDFKREPETFAELAAYVDSYEASQ
jgi:hypothetical protein